MNSRKAIILFSVLVALALGLAGCSSSSTPPPPPVISVAFSPQPPTPSRPAQARRSRQSLVTTPVTAGCSGRSPAPDSAARFFPATTASGQATTYTAPNVPPSPNTVTVTAVSVTDNTVRPRPPSLSDHRRRFLLMARMSFI